MEEGVNDTMLTSTITTRIGRPTGALQNVAAEFARAPHLEVSELSWPGARVPNELPDPLESGLLMVAKCWIVQAVFDGSGVVTGRRETIESKRSSFCPEPGQLQ